MVYLNDRNIAALAASQQRFDQLSNKLDDIQNPYYFNSQLIWQYKLADGQQPRNQAENIMLTELVRFQTTNFKQFMICNHLRIWEITRLLKKKAEAWFCFQLSHNTPFLVRISRAGSQLKLFFRQSASIPLEKFLNLLLTHYPIDIADYQSQHEYWLVTGKKFNWSGLPNEVKWQVIEQLNEPEKISPFFYRRGHPRSLFHSRHLAEHFATLAATPPQIALTMPGHIFHGLAVEYDMFAKTAIRSNLFWFERPGFLARWLREMSPNDLKEVRQIHLDFSHGDFMRFFSSDAQPNPRGHGSFVSAVKKLGSLNLDTLYIEPRLSEDMRIGSYFTHPQQFGCHEKAIIYIAGRAARHLPNTRKIAFCGNYFRPSWQGNLDETFRLTKMEQKEGKVFAKQENELFFASEKLKTIVEREKKQGKGGVRVPRRRGVPNRTITHRGPYQFEPGVDLPPRQGSTEDLLWPCECHDHCGPDHFNSNDPPPPPPPKVQKKKSPECEAQSEEQQSETTTSRREQHGTEADEDDGGWNWMPENTAYNGSEFWLE